MWKGFRELKMHYKLLWTIFIAVGTVGIWRGIWRLMDLYLLPNYEPLTYIVSFVIGVLIFLGGTSLL